MMTQTQSIYPTFRRWVTATPLAPAIIEQNRSLTYADLDAMVADLLARFTVVAPRRVGIVMDHSAEMIAAMLAVLRAGAAYIPVEPSFPLKRIAFVMDECRADFVITNRAHARRLSHLPLMVVGDATVQNTRTEYDLHPDGTAYILYTSGSTGLPKGVQVTNANVCHYARAFNNEFHNSPGDIMLQYSVCSFDIFVEEVFTTLLNGAALAIPPKSAMDDINRLMDFVDQKQITIISGFPYLLLRLNKLDSLPPSIRLLISGGDILRAAYVDRLVPRIPVYNTYGPSETTVCASYFRCNGSEPCRDGIYPIGRPVLGAEILLLDEKLRPVPQGQEGEICILGDGVSKGYIGNRDVENRAFIPMADGRTIYRSGDVGVMLPDGNLLFRHRMDTQVMIEGRRVELCEVESVLCQCPGIESATVRAFTDDQQMPFLVAYVVPKRHSHLNARTLRRRMGRFLPGYMIPEFFVSLPAMPLTVNGKVNTAQLPEVLKAGSL